VLLGYDGSREIAFSDRRRGAVEFQSQWARRTAVLAAFDFTANAFCLKREDMYVRGSQNIFKIS